MSPFQTCREPTEKLIFFAPIVFILPVECGQHEYSEKQKRYSTHPAREDQNESWCNGKRSLTYERCEWF